MGRRSPISNTNSIVPKERLNEILLTPIQNMIPYALQTPNNMMRSKNDKSSLHSNISVQTKVHSKTIEAP